MNIFQKLELNKVIYAVGAANNTLIGCDDEIGSKDYFLIVLKSDRNEVMSEIGFDENKKLYIMEKSLTPDEIEYFKEHMSEFVVTESNKYGKTYELKKALFKEKYIPLRREWDMRNERLELNHIRRELKKEEERLIKLSKKLEKEKV